VPYDVDVVPDDPMAQRTRAAIVRLLADLRRPARTDELADRIGRHPNSIRNHLERLQAAGLVERLKIPGTRGRPHYEWALPADPAPGREPPTAYRDLARWLARTTATSSADLDDVEATGRGIGREASPSAAAESPPAALGSALAAFGFQPTRSDEADGRTSYSLRNCPYRDVVAETQPLVCVLHRGITQGLLEQLAPGSELTAFVPQDPHEAGCLIAVDWRAATADRERPAATGSATAADA
jgi:predicted ArsR family transcriptional regulator